MYYYTATACDSVCARCRADLEADPTQLIGPFKTPEEMNTDITSKTKARIWDSDSGSETTVKILVLKTATGRIREGETRDVLLEEVE